MNRSGPFDSSSLESRRWHLYLTGLTTYGSRHAFSDGVKKWDASDSHSVMRTSPTPHIFDYVMNIFGASREVLPAKCWFVVVVFRSVVFDGCSSVPEGSNTLIFDSILKLRYSSVIRSRQNDAWGQCAMLIIDIGVPVFPACGGDP